MKKFLLSLLVVVMALTLSSCFQEEFAIQTCGSGFYFNRSAGKNYTIKELNATSIGNYFYLDEYFCSEELGKEYKIKNKIFTVGKVSLAKKSDHYNPEVYSFNIDELGGNAIVITEEMNYVNIYSSSGSEREVYIEVGKRSLPVDITFENVNIRTKAAIPVIYSYAPTDINIILKGNNTLSAGARKHTAETFKSYLEKKAGKLEKDFYAAVEKGVEEIEYLQNIGDTSIGDLYMRYATKITDGMLSFVENAWDKAGQVIMGKAGADGLDGVDTIIHPMGISFSGTGSITITGGDGANGGDASNSLLGGENGGDGGRGGSAIMCGKLLIDHNTKVTTNGGEGGNGGQPSKGGFGLFGSSGEEGNSGSTGKSVDVANPILNK